MDPLSVFTILAAACVVGYGVVRVVRAIRGPAISEVLYTFTELLLLVAVAGGVTSWALTVIKNNHDRVPAPQDHTFLVCELQCHRHGLSGLVMPTKAGDRCVCFYTPETP